jgi:DNA primase large subunit
MKADFSKYPFLVSLSDYMVAVHKYVVDLDSLLQNTNITDLAIRRIESAIKGRIFDDKGLSTDDLVISFHIAVLLIKKMNSRWLQSRFANFEAERSYRFLQGEDQRSFLNVMKVSGLNAAKLSEELRILIGHTRSGREVYEIYDYVIGFQDYLRYTRRFWGEGKWKLVNRPVSKGFVFVKKDELVRIGKEVFYAKIMEIFDRTQLVPAEALESLAGKVRDLIPEKYSDTGGLSDYPLAGKEGKIVVEALPPCIKRIYNAMLKGENLGHHERFAIATFLLALNIDIEYLVNLFRNLPDFNEKITRYQIEHLAGKRGSGRRYSPYNCENMRSRGLCVAECGVKHPLTYYFNELKKLKKGREKPQPSSSETRR